MRHVLGFVLAGGAVVALAAACTNLDGGADPVGEDELAELQAESRGPVYWVGESFDGHALVHAERLNDEVTLIYGDCEIEDQGWFQDGGCAPPIDIQQPRIAARHPASFDAAFACRRTTVRGVPAAIFDSSGGALEVYTGDRVIVIFGETPEQQRRIAEALRPLDGSADAGDPLPPPTVRVDGALAACRRVG